MRVDPTDHFSITESIVSKTSELSAYFERVRPIAEANTCDVLWRGQADQSWGIVSSLVRKMRSDVLTDKELRMAEDTILGEAKRRMSVPAGLRSDLEWLAYPQHHGVPTRLLDFTPDPLIATFFACESLDDADGRIFAVLTRKGEPALDGSTDHRVDETPSGAVRIFRPRPEVSPRLAAQSGVFLLGKLPSTQVNRLVKDSLVGLRQMLKDEVASIMSLPFYFRPENQAARATSTAVAAYTARVHISKAAVRREFAGEGRGNRNLKPPQRIDHAYCYPDIEGLRIYSRIWSQLIPMGNPPLE